MDKRKFYVTNAIPYVNAPPHLGHALEFVQADTVARYHRLLGEDVYYLTGADENALKNVLAAEEAGVPTSQLVSENTAKFRSLKKVLNLSYDNFICTSDSEKHWPGVQRLWRECQKSGDIYQRDYQGLYCVGCEEFKTEKDLVDGLCPDHKIKPELIKERNYFFRLSKYQRRLENLVQSDKLKIIPEHRKNEVLSFIKSGLQDFSVSRSKERVRGWGVPVPGDPSQIIYVWYDALVSYITALGYGLKDDGLLKKYWPANLHIIGKGITRFHAIYWPAMLLSAGLGLPQSIFVHGYITIGGEKISKSLGNTIDPYEAVRKYGADAVRFYLLKTLSPTADGDFSSGRFEEVYHADLANGIGNLASRVLRLVEEGFNGKVPAVSTKVEALPLQSGIKIETWKKYQKAVEELRFNEALVSVWEFIAACDKYVDEKRPWENPDPKVIFDLLESLHQIAWMLYPFLPATAAEIGRRLGVEALRADRPRVKDSWEPLRAGAKISAGESLFPRLSQTPLTS